MECCSSPSSSILVKLASLSSGSSLNYSSNYINNNKLRGRRARLITCCSYNKFIEFALDQTKLHTHLVPSPLQESYRCMTALDGKTELQMISFQAPKIRLLTILSALPTTDVGQLLTISPFTHRAATWCHLVLDFAIFPEPEFDLPIFCANFYSAAKTNIVVLDLNPLHDIISNKDYKDKYYKKLIPLGLKYAELLPWGGKITSESLRFFSPIVIWTKFSSSQDNYNVLYSAFMEYYKAWLALMDQAEEEIDITRISYNQKAQHRYLTWREQKDPGHQLLKKLVGETSAKDLMRNFLFHGVKELGSDTFLDYFPEYKGEDGTVNLKRSIIGKSYENRPWDSKGDFVGT